MIFPFRKTNEAVSKTMGREDGSGQEKIESDTKVSVKDGPV